MTDMIHLIVPPIIVVFAVAILMVFLAKNISSNDDGGSFILKKKPKNPGRQPDFFKNSNKGLKKKRKVKNKRAAEKKNAREGVMNGSNTTRDAASGKSKEKVVSLRKKSMVSDKIENSEGRKPEEIDLMEEIEKKPQDSKGYEKLGDYYMEHEQFEDARECYKYVLRLNPRHKRAQVAMKNLDRVLE